MLRMERWAVAGAAVVVWLVAFVAYSSYELMVPGGSRASFTVEGLSGIGNAAQAIQGVADGCGCAIRKISADPDDADGRVMYLFDGRGDAPLAYGDFTRGRTTAVLPGALLGSGDVRGFYTADRPGGRSLTVALTERGVIAGPAFFDTSLFASLREIDGSVWAVAGALALGLGSAICYGTVQRRRRDAVWAVEGRSAASRYFRDAGSFALATAVAGAGAGAAGLVFLGWYNGWNQLGAFAAWAGAGMAGLVAVVLALHGLARVSCPRLRIVALLKGGRPAAYSWVMAVGLQALTVAVAAAGVNLSIGGLREARDMREFEPEWRAASDLVMLHLDGGPAALSSEAGEDTAFVLEQDAAGQVILVYQGNDYWARAHGGAHVGSGVEVGAGSTMLVNPNYLAREAVLDQAGAALDPAAFDRFTVLVPEHLAAYSPVYQAAGFEFAAAEALDFQDRTALPGVGLKPEVRLIKSRQTLFTFSGPSYYSPAAWIDPVVYVLPLGLGILSPDSLRGHMSNGSLLFSDAAAVRRAVEGGMSWDSRPEILSLTGIALDTIAGARREAWTAVAALVLALGVLALAAVVFAASDCLRHRRELFARLIHGRRLAPLTVPTAVLAAGAGGAGLGLAAGVDVLGAGAALWASVGLVALNAAVAFAVMLTFVARRKAEWLKLY